MEHPPTSSERGAENSPFRLEIDAGVSIEAAADSALRQLAAHYGVPEPKIFGHCMLTYAEQYNWRADGHLLIVLEGSDFESGVINPSAPRPVFWVSGSGLRAHSFENDIEQFADGLAKEGAQ